MTEHWECLGTISFEKCCTTHYSSQCAIWTSGARVKIIFDGSVARSFGRSVARSLGRSVARSLGRSVARSLARSLGRSVARSLDRSIARSLDRSIARSLDRSIALDRSVARSLGTLHKIVCAKLEGQSGPGRSGPVCSSLGFTFFPIRVVGTGPGFTFSSLVRSAPVWSGLVRSGFCFSRSGFENQVRRNPIPGFSCPVRVLAHPCEEGKYRSSHLNTCLECW